MTGRREEERKRDRGGGGGGRDRRIGRHCSDRLTSHFLYFFSSFPSLDRRLLPAHCTAIAATMGDGGGGRVAFSSEREIRR